MRADAAGALNQWKILLLPSSDGQDYAMACLIPASMSNADATAFVEEVTAFMNQEDDLWIESNGGSGAEWEWDEFARRLTEKGFQFLEVEHGPIWD